MKVKVRRSYFGKEGRVSRGQILEMNEARFAELSGGIHSANPLVDPVEVGYKMSPAVKNKMETDLQNKQAHRTIGLDGGMTEAARTAAVSPTTTSPAGGPTGEASAVSSSEPAPQRTKRKYTKRAVAPVSSVSIDPGSSRRGLTFSMGATSPGGKNTKASRPSKG